TDLLALAARTRGRALLPGAPPESRAELAARATDLEGRLDLAEELLGEAAEAVEHALRAIPHDDRERLRAELFAIARDLKSTVYVTERAAHTTAWQERISKLDVASLERAAACLTALTDPAFWGDLGQEAARLGEASVEGAFGALLAVRDTPLGKVIVGGAGANRYTLPAALIVDAGGDDVYAGAIAATGPGRPVAVVVDLSGDDTYRATAEDGAASPPAQAAGILGVALLAD